MSVARRSVIREQVLRLNSHLSEDALDVVVPTIELREAYVRDMAAAPGPLSPEWNEASRKIVECEVILANFGLV